MQFTALIVSLLLPIAAPQEPSVEQASEAFNTAWLVRDKDAIKKLVAPKATVFSVDGGDESSFASAIRRQDRSYKNMTSSEVVVRSEAKTLGNTAVVTRVSRVDHKSRTKRSSVPKRQTEFWSRIEGTWKLTHLHQSSYTNFGSAIAAFEREDEAGLPKPGGVVFVGSSSIRMWKTLNEDFPNTNNTHRGFGGSQLIDSIMYCDRIITKYAPSKVVVYAGDNDVAAGKDAEQVLQDFKTLVASIHARIPQAKVGFIAIKPSRARWNLWPEMDKANKLVAEFASTDPRLAYFDIATPMLSENGGKPAEDWFVNDGLHMTPKGYALWTKVIRPWVEF